ncbi:hypothetical protein [Gordonia sp. (in: high G+C Gram-positive bacteria)]|uniref:hypothetical protein n=1 Tax=Gordonia sp. (in: high G+C Gram-positive bacteria) TaxID=84139 RepID=UPI0025BC62CF|nr:hypothetical protein [Gordonia sp. (in: high G+C Gram-positive bacteria)]
MEPNARSLRPTDMDIGGEHGLSVDLGGLAQLTRMQEGIVRAVDACAVQLASDDLCRWADDGPVHRSAVATAEQLRELAARFRSCGIAVDAVAADLGRANRAFAESEGVAVHSIAGADR